MLGVDTYARRRYPEVLGPESPLVGLIADFLSGGEARREENLRYDSLNGRNHSLQVSVMPVQNSSRELVAVVCLLNELRPGAE